jgi:hypothetical protein
MSNSLKSTVNLITKIECVRNEIQDHLKVQRELMSDFSNLKDEITVDKLRILGEGYSHCLRMINKVLIDK